MRDYAREKKLSGEAALEEGMKEKAKEFRKGGGEIYRGA
jgi:phosphomethylpyrimidine synthase